MRAAIEMPYGRSKLETLLAAFPSGHERWNEAENRFQFIDELLKECLGWEKPNIHVEVTDEGGGRADYVWESCKGNS